MIDLFPTRGNPNWTGRRGERAEGSKGRRSTGRPVHRPMAGVDETKDSEVFRTRFYWVLGTDIIIVFIL